MTLSFMQRVRLMPIHTYYSLNPISVHKFSTVQSQLLPSYSRLTRNACSWHKKYDKNYKGPLSPQQVESYYENGFVLINDILPQSLIDASKEGINNMIDKLAKQLYSKGLIKDICDSGNNIDNFKYRLTNLEEQYPGVSVVAHKLGTLEKQWLKLWEFPLLTEIAFQLLQPEGNDIGAHPVWNVRCKVPDNEEATVPWHQDVSYLTKNCWATHQLTAWIPLVNADEKMGCMQIVKESHKSGSVATHTTCAGHTWYTDLNENIMKKELFENEEINLNDYIVTCEVSERSVLFLNNIVVHRSLQNYSDEIRWSFDFRWQDMSLPSGVEKIKPCLKIGDKNDKNYKVNWDEWNEISRHSDEEIMQLETDVSEIDALSPIIVGPWMDFWELVHTNKHTDAWFSGQETQKWKRKEQS